MNNNINGSEYIDSAISLKGKIKEKRILLTREENKEDMTAEFKTDKKNMISNENELKSLNEKIIINEEKIMKLENHIELLRNENISQSEELEKSKAKQKALEIYCSNLQRKLDEYKESDDNKKKIIDELSKKEWNKQIQNINQENNLLKKIIQDKDKEIEEMRNQSKLFFKTNRNLSNKFFKINFFLNI